MEKGQMRELFLSGCRLAAEPLQQNGFRCLENGQRWKKLSFNKDMTYEVIFQSSHYNTEKHIECVTTVFVNSKKVKAMNFELTKSPYESGRVLGVNLGNDRRCRMEWNFADECRETSAKAIAAIIRQYVLPVFDLFDEPEKAVEHIKNNSTAVNEYLPIGDPDAVTFMILYGGKATAEAYLNRWVSLQAEPFKERIRKWYPTLATAEKIDTQHNEFCSAHELKMAYLYGIRLHFDCELQR